MIEKYSIRTDLALEQKERFESDHVEIQGVVLEEDYDEEREIRITRVRVDRQTLLMQVINTLGSQVDLASARAILNNLVQAGALEENAGRSILAAVGDKALAAVPRESRDTVRADIMKQVLILQV